MALDIAERTIWWGLQEHFKEMLWAERITLPRLCSQVQAESVSPSE